NTTGNPGMATGGMGDVLTGLIAALLCQGLDPFDAARLGVHLHGRAGDLCAEDLGQVAMIASDMIDYLPEAFQEYAS
ncbi:MAG: NAD(P)H-hydrate dehydratase, partial [Thermoguttaceae bacterium]